MKIGYFPGKHLKNNVSFFLEEQAKKQPEKIAFKFLSKKNVQISDFTHQTLTYGDFNDTVRKFSGGLIKAGIKKGQRILVFVPISPQLYISIAGLQRIGAIPVLLDSWTRQEQLTEIVQNSQPVGMIAPNKWLQGLGKNLSHFGINIQISISDSAEKGKALQFNHLLEEKAHEIISVNQNDTALITYTTGSSGTPKGVNRTHRFLSAQHYALKRLFPYNYDDIDLPIFPVFALNNIASGITTVIPAIDISNPNQKDSEILITQIKECKVNCMTLAPSSFRNLAKYCNSKNIRLQNISRVLTGGAPISETDIFRFTTISPHSKNWILYGSTEVEPIAYIESQEMLSIKPPKWKNATKVGVNVGKIDTSLDHKFIDIKTDNIDQTIDIKNIEVKRGEVGELIVSGEHVCEGYYKNKEAFKRAKIKDKDGTIWHRTGDLARIDRNDFLWVVGRKHNLIYRDNEYYFPVRPEIILKDLPHVISAAYLDFIDGKKQKIAAVVVLEKEDSRLKNICRENIIDIFKQEELPIDEIYFLEEIPMDVRHHSKVDYRKLREKLHDLPA